MEPFQQIVSFILLIDEQKKRQNYLIQSSDDSPYRMGGKFKIEPIVTSGKWMSCL
jgi:hypothetical protein